MADDFSMYQGDDMVPYFVVYEDEEPVDLSAWSAATWVATPMDSGTALIEKHKGDMTLNVDPDFDEAIVENTIFVSILPADTAGTGGIGQFKHELRITLDGKEAVIYPLVGTTATFRVVDSLTYEYME